MSADPFRKFELDQREVLALDMGDSDFVACLSTHKHCEIIIPLFAPEPEFTSTISKAFFPRHELINFVRRLSALWQRFSSLVHR